MIEKQQSALDRAIAYLGADEVAPGRYAYRDDATRRYHVVAEASLETLGTDLVALDGHETHWTGVDGDPGTMAEAYSQWCGDTTSVEMPAWWTPEYQVHFIPASECSADEWKNGTASSRYVTVSLETGEECPLEAR